MTQPDWSTLSQNSPPVSWDANTREFVIRLDGLGHSVEEPNVEARWKPQVTYVVRIRKAGTDSWSPGFETPMTSHDFTDLEPDTEYEVSIQSKNDAGVSEPVLTTFRTKPEDATSV